MPLEKLEGESPGRSTQTTQCEAEGWSRDGDVATVKAQTLGAGSLGVDIGAAGHETADMS